MYVDTEHESMGILGVWIPPLCYPDSNFAEQITFQKKDDTVTWILPNVVYSIQLYTLCVFIRTIEARPMRR